MTGGTDMPGTRQQPEDPKETTEWEKDKKETQTGQAKEDRKESKDWEGDKSK